MRMSLILAARFLISKNHATKAQLKNWLDYFSICQYPRELKTGWALYRFVKGEPVSPYVTTTYRIGLGIGCD